MPSLLARPSPPHTLVQISCEESAEVPVMVTGRTWSNYLKLIIIGFPRYPPIRNHPRHAARRHRFLHDRCTVVLSQLRITGFFMAMGTDGRSSGAPSRPSSFKFAAAAVEPQHISTLGCKLTKQTTRYGTTGRTDEPTDIHLTRCGPRPLSY